MNAGGGMYLSTSGRTMVSALVMTVVFVSLPGTAARIFERMHKQVQRYPKTPEASS